MGIRRSLTMVAASVALLGSAVACSGGGSGGNPLASDPNGPTVPAPRDTSGFIPGTPPLSH